jgi:radical SAM superfamily enzyme YgiQ (UPF0313 family)
MADAIKMATILLISCNVTEEPYPVYPLGLTMVAAAARAKGHEVFEWDILVGERSTERAVEAAKRCKPDMVGLSLRNVDNVNFAEQETYVPHYKEFVRRLRQDIQAPIVLGGSAYSLFPEEMLAETGADYGIAGEGEETFCDLVEQLAKGITPDKTIFRGHRMLRGDEISFAKRNKSFAKYYLQNGGMLNIQTKRGCPHKCIYCSYPALEGRRYRYRPVKDVVDEMQELCEKYNADYLSITDSVLNDSEGNYLRVAEEIVRRNMDVPWMAFLRPQHFRKDEVALLKRAGLSAVEWGSDASCDVTLRRMQKDFDWATVVESNDLFSDMGIANSHFVIFGGPGETEKTVLEGLDNVSRLKNCVVFACIGIRIFPNTSIHKLAAREGIISGSQNLLEPAFYFSPHVDPDFLHNTIVKRFGSRRDRVFPFGQGSEKIKAFHRLGYRGPIWNFLLPGIRGRENN